MIRSTQLSMNAGMGENSHELTSQDVLNLAHAALLFMQASAQGGSPQKDCPHRLAAEACSNLAAKSAGAPTADTKSTEAP